MNEPLDIWLWAYREPFYGPPDPITYGGTVESLPPFGALVAYLPKSENER